MGGGGWKIIFVLKTSSFKLSESKWRWLSESFKSVPQGVLEIFEKVYLGGVPPPPPLVGIGLKVAPAENTANNHVKKFAIKWRRSPVEYRYICKSKLNQAVTPEPWFVITHTIWTTQEDTVFIIDRTAGTVVNVKFWEQTFRGTPSPSVKARKNVWHWHSFWLSLMMRESLETSALKTEHWPPFRNKNCVLLCRSNRVYYHESGF